LALARPPLTLLAVGRQSPHKNWRRIVEALAIARDRHGVVARVDMLGPCENLWGREAEYCRAVRDDLRRLDLEASWSWLGKRGDVPAHLAAHHALVHPSHSEGLPNVVCEALACGRPVLVSRVLDHPRLVQEGETGFLFDPARPEELAEAIARLARLPDDELLRMGRAARAFAEQNLSLARMADDYERLFGEVLTCGAGRVDQP
jgi:glycosyltransferase involved in cell wall biosynthesis